MTRLTITPPSIGEKNVVAEPKVDVALKEVEAWANGNVGAVNIGEGVLTEAMLSTAVQTLLNTKSFAALTYIAKNEASYTASSGQLVLMEKASSILTLPTPTANRIVGVYSSNSGVKVRTAAGGQYIFGDFVSTTSSTVE